jgi:F-type H+-transporting ATPase subunit epsilon
VDEEEVSAVALPSVDGELGILPGHRSIITAVGSGTLIIEKGKAREEYPIHGGTAEIHPDRVRIFTNPGKDPSLPE